MVAFGLSLGDEPSTRLFGIGPPPGLIESPEAAAIECTRAGQDRTEINECPMPLGAEQ